MKHKTLPLIVLAVTLLLSACGMLGSGSEFERQRSTWEDQSFGHYRFTITTQCFCLFANTPVTYEVMGGQVVDVTISPDVDLGGASLEEVTLTTQDLNTVEKLFAYVESALNEADKVEVTYDQEFGFPVQVSVDWIELAIDDEFAFFITDFAVLP